MFYVDEFNKLDEENENCSYNMLLFQIHYRMMTGMEIQGLYIKFYLKNYLKHHPSPEDCEYYLCGPPMMNKAIIVIDMLQELGVERENIALDDFGG